jgi:mRNA interferase MazF
MYEFGKIVLVPFPFIDLSSSKVRPALIISKDKQKYSSDVIVCFIGSVIQEGKYKAKIKNNKKTGLKVPSIVHFDKIATLDKKMILGELGTADKEFLKKNAKIFFSLFGF